MNPPRPRRRSILHKPARLTNAGGHARFNLGSFPPRGFIPANDSGTRPPPPLDRADPTRRLVIGTRIEGETTDDWQVRRFGGRRAGDRPHPCCREPGPGRAPADQRHDTLRRPARGRDRGDDQRRQPRRQSSTDRAVRLRPDRPRHPMPMPPTGSSRSPSRPKRRSASTRSASRPTAGSRTRSSSPSASFPRSPRRKPTARSRPPSRSRPSRSSRGRRPPMTLTSSSFPARRASGS